MLRILGLLSVLCFLPALSGCIVVAAGAAAVGTYTVVQGNVEGVVDASVDELVEASRAVLEKHDVLNLKEETNSETGRVVISGKNPEGRRVEVNVRPVESDTTLSKLWVRVGVLSDREASEAVWTEIHDRAVN